MVIIVKLDQPMDLMFQKRIPWRAVIEVTNACQLNCIHCYHEDHIKKDELNTNVILQTIKDLKELGTMQLTITGGEATLRSDISDIIKNALDMGLSVQLLSNGQIENNILKKLLKFKTKFSVEVSLLGSEIENDLITGQKGSYQKAISVIQELASSSIKTSINTVVMKQNYNSLKKLYDICKGLNVKWSHTPIIYGDKDNKYRLNDNELLEYYKLFSEQTELIRKLKYMKKETINYSKNCNAGYTTILIDCTGNVYPCIWLREKSLGNIKNETLHKIWFNDEIFDDILNEKKIGFSGCLECKYYSVCRKCPGYAYAETGQYDECPLEWCRHMKVQEKAIRSNF